MVDDILQKLLEEIRGLAKVRIREPIDVRSEARGYEFEAVDADPDSITLEVYGQRGDWIIFVEDGTLETGDEATADSLLEHAVWGILAFGASEWRRHGLRYWSINTGATTHQADRSKFGKLLQTKAPISIGAQNILPIHISVERIEELRFYA